MSAITITDLSNAKLDVDHIAAIASSTALTVTDRFGFAKTTLAAAIDSIKSWTNRGVWATATYYAGKDLVFDGGSWYVCVIPHTSSVAFATDVANWRLFQGVTLGDLAAYSGTSLVGHTALGAGAVARMLDEELQEEIKSTQYSTMQQAVNAAAGKTLRIPAGTHNITSEVTLPSDIRIVGDGQGVTILNFQKASNPATSEFMLAARSESNITIENLTLKSNAYADGLFNVGTYTAGPPKTYSGSLNGNINGLLISSCANVTVSNCEVTGFNYHGIRVSVENSTDYNTNLTFDKIYGHHCLVAPVDILGTKDFKVINGTFTDNGNFTASYIDGGTGYGIVLGRTPSASQLRSFGGLCANNFCARNARHGIDVHAGGNIIIQGNVVEDNLLQGISVQDNSGSADDTLVGDVSIVGNTIYHTSWVESRYALITWIDATNERQDSIPIYASQLGNSLLQNITVANNTIRSWRFRQITTNVAGTDLIGMLAVWATGNAKVTNNSFDQTNTSYLPSYGLDMTAVTAEVSGNNWKCGQRSTVSKPFFSFATTGDCSVSANHFELTNTYTDAGVTQAAYPMFKANSSIISFTGNSIVQTTQGTRGSLWYTTGTNNVWGFNGVLTANSGNMLKLGGATWMEYASQIKGDLTIYMSDAGSGRFDGLSSGNRFVATNAAQFMAILNDMPHCESGMVVMIDADQLDWGADAGVTIPDWQDNITFRGLSSETANSMTKTGGIKTTGNNLITCPERSQNINFEYLYLKSAGSSVAYRPANVKYCAIEGTSNGQIGVYCEYKSSYIRNTRFKGPGAGTSIAIGAFLGANITSQVNDSDASQFAYGLNANSAAIRKNSTQPTGATANELAQNGGTIA